MKKLPLSRAFSEINRANRALFTLRAAGSFPTAEEAWIDGVASIERAWEKAYAEFRMVDGFVEWNTEFVGLRRSDPLLRYVHQARNAADHTIEDTVQLNRGGWSLGPAQKGGSLFIKRLEVSAGRITHLDTGGTPVRFDMKGPHPELMSFTCRGVKFDPPAMHLGKAVAGRSPAEVLSRAIEFYESYLQRLRETFSKPD